MFQFPQVFHVERICAADRERDAVHDDLIPFGNLIQHVAWATARVHEILRDNLEPIDLRMVLEDVREMNRTQPNAKPKIVMSQPRFNHD